jgi:hypothetical protein
MTREQAFASAFLNALETRMRYRGDTINRLAVEAVKRLCRMEGNRG